MSFSVISIGRTFAGESGFGVEIAPEYRAGLRGLEGFSYVQVLWWGTECDNEHSRGKLVENKPYRNAPEILGTFATRSPERPNPIGVSVAYVTHVDAENGVIGLAWLDAFDGTPVIDIKPYVPSIDRVEAPEVPEWCAHWPKNVETSGEFDWEDEFLF